MKKETEKVQETEKKAFTVDDLIESGAKGTLLVFGQHDSLKITGTVAGIEGNILILENVEVKTV